MRVVHEHKANQLFVRLIFAEGQAAQVHQGKFVELGFDQVGKVMWMVIPESRLSEIPSETDGTNTPPGYRDPKGITD